MQSFSVPAVAVVLGILGACLNPFDPNYCASEVVVVISSIADGGTITTDVSPNPGIQINVPIGSNLAEGDVVTLIVSAGDNPEEVSRQDGISNATGDVLFTNIDVPEGLVTLRAEATSGSCGSGADEVQFNVALGGGCDLTIREGLLDSDFYAPLQVLNASNDSDSNTADFQANIDVATGVGNAVELFVLDIDSASETSAGVITSEDPGVATFAQTLANGRLSLRAVCISGDGNQTASATLPMLVDTNVPVCSFAYPADGSSIIPEMDSDGDINNGTQLTLVGHVDDSGDGDVEGEVAIFMVNTLAIDGTLLDGLGDSTSTEQATFTDVGIHALSFAAQDRAGNSCMVTQDSNYVTAGCGITLLDPTGPVTTDSNGMPGDGMQVILSVDVTADCEGLVVTTDCGEGMTMGTVPAGGGTVMMEVTACPDAQCEIVDVCSINVSNDAGIETAVGTTLVFDNQPPNVELQFINPVTTCGSAVAPSQDVDLAMTGLQIEVRVSAPLADTRTVEVSNSAMPPPFMADNGGDAIITVEPGLNTLEGVALDSEGNEGRSGTCEVSVFDIVIGFGAPVNDGLVGSNEGVVNLNDINFDLCGTVSELGASVDVSIDGGAAQAATVIGSNWCLNGVTLSSGSHNIDVSAMAGVQLGQGSIAVVVDLAPPDPIAGLTGNAFNRHSVALAWNAPDNSGVAAAAYIVKVATTPLDDLNFDSTGTALTGPVPSAPGTPESQPVTQLQAGSDYYFGVSARDAAGNRSPVQVVGPLRPDFDATGAFSPPNPLAGDNALGYQITHGDFNGDTFSDIALAAPFISVDLDGMAPDEAGVGQVYVYFGSAAGPPAVDSPADVVISGGEAGGQFGQGLTALEWNGDNFTDLAIGAPLADGVNGRVFVFHGDVAMSANMSTADADVSIGSAASGWFFFGAMGYSLTTARFDNDTNDDLAIAVPFGNGGVGGVAVIYGGHSAASITLDSADPAPSNGAKTVAIAAPGAAGFDIFGQTLVNLGRTEISGDTDDDLGVAFPDQTTAFVIRGRPQPIAAGVTVDAFDFMTDLAVADDSSDTEVFFGSSMASIADQNGDGAREIVIGSWGEGATNGRVRIIDGKSTGNAVDISTIALATITQGVGTHRHFGTTILNNATAGGPADVNADGLEDLLIVGGFGDDVALFIWYGGSIPSGTTTTLTAGHIIDAPSSFISDIPGSNDKPPVQATWVGNVNGDGLTDICWADYTANSRDGAFEVLWDDGM